MRSELGRRDGDAAVSRRIDEIQEGELEVGDIDSSQNFK